MPPVGRNTQDPVMPPGGRNIHDVIGSTLRPISISSESSESSQSMDTSYISDTDVRATPMAFSDIVSKPGPWLIPSWLKKKQRRQLSKQTHTKKLNPNHNKSNKSINTGTKKSNDTQETKVSNKLKGVKFEKTVQVYIRNIMKESGVSNESIENDVKAHGKSKGLTIMFARVVGNKYRDDVVGCLIRIPENQMDNALNESIWPDQIQPRLWDSRERSKGLQQQETNKLNTTRNNPDRYTKMPNESRREHKKRSRSDWFNDPPYRTSNENYGGHYQYNNTNYDSWGNDDEWENRDSNDLYRNKSFKDNHNKYDDWYDMVMEEERNQHEVQYNKRATYFDKHHGY